MADKLVGQDIAPDDLHAKITGRAKYAEDFRADGMVFAKLLPSPMPHCRVLRIDASEALAMEGVIGILTADEVPQSEVGEQCLTNHPHYEGEAVLAIAAVSETIAADAIEKVRVDFEPLPFVLNPLDSLRPNGPNGRLEGNVRVGRDFATIKWTDEDFASAPEGSMPMPDNVLDADGEIVVRKNDTEWMVGDVEAGFAEADLILDETIVHQSVTHHPMEPRSTMAYWQNGRLFMHTSTQSLVRTRQAVAGQLGLDMEDVVMIGEYCGGGFGSKITGSTIQLVPALFARKINRPVMLRITRAEETYLGRARPGMQARVRIGYRADGRITAMDLYALGDGGPFAGGDQGSSASTASLTYTPLSMRFRGVGIRTNTPPKAAQRGPGGAQIIGMLEPLMDKAARELGVDRLALRRLNAPTADVRYGPRGGSLTSVFVREAIDQGRELFNWEERISRSGQLNGTKRTGVGVGVSPYTAGSRGFDGLLVIQPDGKVRIHQGLGNLGTNSIFDTARAAADVLGVEWSDVEVVWGDTSRNLPWSAVQAGSQSTHAHTRANHAAGLQAKEKLQSIAAMDLGGNPGDYDTADGRVFQRSNPSRGMTLGQAATRAIALGGRYSGEELDDDLNAMTEASASAMAGEGLLAAARDNFGGQGGLQSWVVGFAEVELDVETGKVDVVHFTAVTDCGTVVHPRGLGGQVYGGSFQGMGMAMSQKWVFDPVWGVSFAKRLYTARPPGILDVPLDVQWAAVELPDPQTPVGAKGIGEPCVGAGSAALTSAIADAMEGTCLCRTPLTPDVLLAEIEGRAPAYGPLDLHV
ncbi:MAG TPA: xanthine dehydrogenase family protein molybdopterin-binding subunit [Gemmatimonadetes bacterium]|nr:xanthine dehydrogenase family protein molybdopterin-binding subunit [Gemmatimonadota bacterium]